MIGKLKGIIDSISEDHLLLDVNGVGYIIYCSSKTLSNIGTVKESCSLLTHMQVREDDISLYGFKNSEEKEWFNNLITVQGIGAKLALTILSMLTPKELAHSIVNRSKEDFKHISGIGPKLAERIFTELSKKANLFYSSIPLPNNASSFKDSNDSINDALIALTNLGYSRMDAFNICKNIGKK